MRENILDQIETNEVQIAVLKNELCLIKELKLTPKRDGNMFCFLFGENLAEGVFGFGASVYEAMIDFNKNFYKDYSKKEKK